MGATTVTERERKFDFDDGRPVPRLAGVGPVAEQAPPRESRIDNTYFDTPDLRLARAGVTLRRRVGGEDAGWHLKRPSDGGARQELRFPPGDPMPDELVEAAREWTGGADLVEVAHLRVDRFSHDLTGSDGRRLAVLTDDHVHGERAGAQAHLDRWRELEVELDAGHPDLLETLTSALLADGVRPAHWPSKLRRLLAADLAADAERGNAGEAVMTYIRAQVEAIRQHDEGVRRGDDDSVHRLRVSLRRLRSALRGYRRLFVRDRAKTLAAELKWAGRALSRARDGEVRRETLLDELAKFPRDPEIEHARRTLLSHLDETAERDREALLAALNSERYARLLGALDQWVAEPPLTTSAESGRKELRRAVRRAERRLSAAVGALRDAPDPDAALHEVRKKAKTARYVADAARPVLGKRLRSWRRAVKSVHRDLGEYHDLVSAGELVRERAGDSASAADAFVFGRLYERARMRCTGLRKDFERARQDMPGAP
ncbi:CYTH and CHAD domain-containing protein [Amycolatopsis thermophila]|uniref:CHAD domain-containing protein n=1 Tax=Amycolatopsis thermophila TaxID=206084 RepID=A0ABU0EWL9_9PSEU|nr:CYTH and CHAD domain-containing protein [Amycolatopsis thermophila]MDQ0379715.1 CHAD domain-containing protein [Amycolatopsis thermophila]